MARDDADDDPDRGHPPEIAEDGAGESHTIGAERDADTELTFAHFRCVGHQAIDADECEEEGECRDARDENRASARRELNAIDIALRGSHIADAEPAVER